MLITIGVELERNFRAFIRVSSRSMEGAIEEIMVLDFGERTAEETNGRMYEGWKE